MRSLVIEVSKEIDSLSYLKDSGKNWTGMSWVECKDYDRLQISFDGLYRW